MRVLVAAGIVLVIQILPEAAGIDSAVLDLAEVHTLVVLVVKREEARDAHGAGGGGDEPGH
ncbi:MAG: hypothetical protein V4773_11370, partial [Verrucomicrobiota bacterium]